jgi:multisubunit Na+/H+ antiporter MnhC subunit
VTAASALNLVRDTSGYFEENCRIWSNNCVADPISKVVVLTLLVVGGIGFLAASLLALTWTPNND